MKPKYRLAAWSRRPGMNSPTLSHAAMLDQMCGIKDERHIKHRYLDVIKKQLLNSPSGGAQKDIYGGDDTNHKSMISCFRSHPVKYASSGCRRGSATASLHPGMKAFTFCSTDIFQEGS